MHYNIVIPWKFSNERTQMLFRNLLLKNILQMANDFNSQKEGEKKNRWSNWYLNKSEKHPNDSFHTACVIILSRENGKTQNVFFVICAYSIESSRGTGTSTCTESDFIASFARFNLINLLKLMWILKRQHLTKNKVNLVHVCCVICATGTAYYYHNSVHRKSKVKI